MRKLVNCCERQDSKQISSILQMEAYKIIFALYCNKAARINFSVFNKMSNIFNQLLVSMSVLPKAGTFNCIANATFIYSTLTSRISHRICTNYASGPERPGGSSCSICSILATPLISEHQAIVACLWLFSPWWSWQSVADPGFANGGPKSSAEGASIEAPKAPRGVGREEGVCLPRNFFDFESENGDFWCILCAILQFTVQLTV